MVQHALDEVVTGANNTAIGSGAGQKTELGNNNTLLGYDAQPSASGVSNEVTIGNDDVVNTRLKGNVSVEKDSLLSFYPEDKSYANIKFEWDTGDAGYLHSTAFNGMKWTVNGNEAMSINSVGNVLFPTIMSSTGTYSNVSTGGAPNVHIASDGTFYRSTATFYSTEEVDKKLAIKDKLIEKLSARLDSLELKFKALK